MPAAARVGDVTGHPGVLTGPGVATVLIGGLPAAVAGDAHTCAFPPPAGPHPPGVVDKGSNTVLIGGKPAVRMGDTASCKAPIVTGAFNVQIGG
ncbi:MAG: PAAR domain-containing protein [Actinomycetota bacterium]|nr:PAAR domain-containing protein [Actinomycetota bacterium]